MRLYRRKLKTSWIKAAAIGSFWGSLEIILGSYLHNLRVPMAGTFLTMLAILLLTIFTYIWRENGIALKAGLIAALLKSISPSSVLLGPMTAIALEGALFEAGISLFGRNLFGFIFAGIITELSVVLHKIASLLIIYGFDIVKIAENFYYFLLRQLSVDWEMSALEALFLFFTIYSVVGALTAAYAYRIAKIVSNEIDTQPNRLNSKFNEIELLNLNAHINNLKPAKKATEAFKILINIVFAIALIAVINSDLEPFIVISLFVVVMAGYYMHYSKAFRYFKKPFFWFQFLVLFALAILFYQSPEGSFKFTYESVWAASKMILRALVVIVFFSTLSIQIRDPFITTLMLRRGLNNLYLTLVFASSALPYFMKQISNKPNLNYLKQLIFITIALYEHYNKHIFHRKLVIIEGDRNAGKTAFTSKVVELLNDAGLVVGGVITFKKFTQNELDYFVKNLLTEEYKLLCTTKKVENPYYKTRRFYFLREGIKFGIQALEQAANKPVIVVDEVGILELRNLGWSRILDNLLSLEKLMIWTVRKHYVPQILGKFFINEAIIFNIENDTPQQVANYIFNELFKVDSSSIDN